MPNKRNVIFVFETSKTNGMCGSKKERKRTKQNVFAEYGAADVVTYLYGGECCRYSIIVPFCTSTTAPTPNQLEYSKSAL